MEAGPGRGGKPGRGPRRLGRDSAQGLMPPAPRLPRGAALAPTPRHLSQLGWQRNPRTVPGQRARAPSYLALPAVAQPKRKLPGGRGDTRRTNCPTCPATQSRYQVPPRMRARSPERWGAASRAMVPQRGGRGALDKTPPCKRQPRPAWAAGLRVCGLTRDVSLRGRAELERPRVLRASLRPWSRRL
ncbi:unnamed protein product [Rangifer tarandus platyrhynchus]|uniref:Uncharacterized protein n=1 Tax=Rangifer tarandus platyrhynchus TaxID=3082113 RepID=A0ABN8YE75_RANTA|nr:unnamed protein product [Rangifer tarandus platyrhynchus]